MLTQGCDTFGTPRSISVWTVMDGYAANWVIDPEVTRGRYSRDQGQPLVAASLGSSPRGPAMRVVAKPLHPGAMCGRTKNVAESGLTDNAPWSSGKPRAVKGGVAPCCRSSVSDFDLGEGGDLPKLSLQTAECLVTGRTPRDTGRRGLVDGTHVAVGMAVGAYGGQAARSPSRGPHVLRTETGPRRATHRRGPAGRRRRAGLHPGPRCPRWTAGTCGPAHSRGRHREMFPPWLPSHPRRASLS